MQSNLNQMNVNPKSTSSSSNQMKSSTSLNNFMQTQPNNYNWQQGNYNDLINLNMPRKDLTASENKNTSTNILTTEEIMDFLK